MIKRMILIVISIPVILFAGVNFDNADDSINCGSGTSIDDIFDSGGTISCWFYAESIISDNHCLLSKTNWRLFIDDNDSSITFFYDFSTTDCYFWTGSFQIAINTWYNLVVTYDNSNVVNEPTIYVNAASQSINTSAPVGTRVSDSSADFLVGLNDGATYPFDGDITEVAAWNTELTAAQVELLYNSRLKRMPLQLSGLQAYWPIDDEAFGTSCDGDGFLDMSGNGNTGTGSDGANNTGLTSNGEWKLSYP